MVDNITDTRGYARGTRPTWRKEETEPANYILQGYIISDERVLLMKDDGWHRRKENENTLENVTLQGQVYEGAHLVEDFFLPGDVIMACWANPGKVVHTDRWDENFSHQFYIDENGMYHLNQWGSQGYRPCELTEIEFMRVLDIITHTGLELPQGRKGRKKGILRIWNNGEMYLRDWEESDDENACPDCEKVNCECECWECDTPKSQRCEHVVAHEEKEKAYEAERHARHAVKRLKDGRRYYASGGPLHPFDYDGNHPKSDLYIMEGKRVTVVSSFDRFSLKMSGADSLHITIEQYLNGLWKNTLDMPILPIIKAWEQGCRAGRAEHLIIPQVYPAVTLEFEFTSAGDVICIQADRWYEWETGFVSLTGKEWERLVEGCREALAWYEHLDDYYTHFEPEQLFDGTEETVED